MVYTIVLYDEFFDMPLRGLLTAGETTLAFNASMVEYEEEPDVFAGRRGVCAKVNAYECSDELINLLEEKRAIFLEWRSSFDRNEVGTDTHPLYVNKRYQELCTRSTEIFQSLTSLVFESTGLIWVENEYYMFEPVEL